MRRLILSLLAGLLALTAAHAAMVGPRRALLAAHNQLAPQTQAFLARVAPQSAAYTTMYNCIIAGSIADGNWKEFDALWVYRAHEQATANTNLVSPSYTITLNGSPKFAPDSGYTPGAATNFLISGFNPTTAPSPKFTQNSASLGAYQAGGTGGFGLLGTTSAAGSQTYIELGNGGNFWRVNDTADHVVVQTPIFGFWAAKKSGTTTSLYQNGALASSGGTNAAPPNNNIIFGDDAYVTGNNGTLWWSFIGSGNVDIGKLSTRMSGCINAGPFSQYTLYDQFSGYADSVALQGRSPITGPTWNTTGAALPTTTGGFEFSSGTGYLYALLPSAPTTLQADVAFSGGTDLTQRGMTFGWAASSNPFSLNDLLHFNLSPIDFNLTIRQGGGAFNSVLSHAWATPVSNNGVIHSFKINVVGATATVTGPTGDTYSVTDARFPSVFGSTVFFEPGTEADGLQAKLSIPYASP